MIILISLLAAVIIFLIVIAAISASGTEKQMVHRRLRSLGNNAEDKAQTTLYWQQHMNKSLSERLLKPILDKLVDKIVQLTPPRIYKSAEEHVEASGGFYGKGMPGFLLFMGFSVVFFMSFFGFMFMTRTSSISYWLLMFVACCVLGIGFPFFYIRRVIDKRRMLIRRAMPDVLDLLCVSVQAGLGFDGALGKVTAKMKGPLIEECERLLQELRMGVTRRSALLRLAKRCGIQEMQLFTAALIQADKLGVGMAQVLEVQSENMREMRRQRAKEEAAKLPVKILFPMVIFIFPVMFVVVLGPALVTIVRTMLK